MEIVDMTKEELTIENLRFDEKAAYKDLKKAEAEVEHKKVLHEKARFMMEVASTGLKARNEAAPKNG